MKARGVAATIVPTLPTASITPLMDTNSSLRNHRVRMRIAGTYIKATPMLIMTLPSMTTQKAGARAVTRDPMAAIVMKIVIVFFGPHRSRVCL